MQREFSPLYARVGYQFIDQSLLECALRHRSAGYPHNERLEFLGDAILSMVIAETLFRHYPQAAEGELSRMRAILVNGEHLAGLARELQLGPYIELGSGELKSGGQERESILADAFEALIGAIYLDSNLETCHRCIAKWYDKHLSQLSEIQPAKDAKSHLQEWTQAHKFPLPTYKATVIGKPHEQTFLVICQITGLPHLAEGASTSRRKAEQIAAQHYLGLLK